MNPKRKGKEAKLTKEMPVLEVMDFLNAPSKYSHNNSRVFFNERTNCIEVNFTTQDGRKVFYDFNIDRVSTPGAVLNWIHQVCLGKTWAEPEMVKEFVAILFDMIPCKWWSGIS